MLSMFIFIIVPATSAQLYGNTIIAANDYMPGVVQALKIAVLAQVTMLGGAVGLRTLRPVGPFSGVTVNLSTSRLDRAAAIVVAVGIAGVIVMSAIGGASLQDYFVYTTSGGYGTFWSELDANLGFLVAVQCVAGIAIVLLPLNLSITRSRHRILPIALAMLASLVLLGAGQRGPFVAAISAAGLVWLKTSRKRRKLRTAMMLGALVLLLITALIGVARGPAINRDVSVSNVLSQPFGAGNNLFLPLAGLSTTVPAEIPYLHGRSYLQIFVLPIPRGLWPTKPREDDVTVVTTRFDPLKSGLYFPAFGEGYANFGYPGVALCGLLLGAMAELLHRRLASSRNVKGTVLLAVEAGVLLQLFSRGNLAPMFTTYIGLLAAAACISRRRSTA
jgi:oligosaccharide repeat unit polymerase